MLILIAGLAIFLGTHSVHLLAPAWRERTVTRMGLMRWKGLYALVSIMGFVLIVHGFGVARMTPQLLYVPPVGLRHLNSLFTLLAFVLIAAAYVPCNHLKQWLGHPMYAGVKLWAFGHLLATGFVHDLVLFGAFLAWAIIGFGVARRRDRQTGKAYPVGTLTADALTVALGVAAWAIFALVLHVQLIGVRPI